MGLSPLTFTGVSTYSSDFQTILTRAVNIASLPLKQLQNSESDLLQRKTQLSSLGVSVSSLANTFTSLASAVSSQGIQATSSNNTLVTANASGASSQATYTIDSITSLASSASETSTTGFADSSATTVSSTGSLKLVVGSNDYNINLGSGKNNLVGLRDAINSLGAGVTASILTTGTGAAPNYLSISANTNGLTTLQLLDDPNGANVNLLTSANQGSDAVFQLNGITVDRQSNVVNDVVPGVNFSLQAKTAAPVTLTLTTSRSALSSALTSFVSGYNGLTTQVDGQIGQAAGLLSGDQIVVQISGLLRQIAGYQAPGPGTANSVQSLADLGITFDAQGQASFDSSKLNNLNDAQLTSAFSFVGSASTGFASLGGQLQQLSDPVTGLIRAQQDSYTSSDLRLKDQISALQGRITVMQTATQARLHQMDALLASLQSQQQILTASIQSVNLALFGKNPTTY